MRRLSVSLAMLLTLPLPGQMGPSPGGYPGGQSGSQVPSIPWPSRKKKGEGKEPKTNEILKTVTGKFRQADDKVITIDADDGRVMEFRRGDKTKVLDQEKERKVTDLRPGDVLSVDATEDNEGYFYAHDIRIVGHAPPPSEKAKDQPEKGAGEPAAPPTPSAMTLPPVVGDTGDENDSPRLRRGAPAKKKAQASSKPADSDSSTTTTAAAQPAPPAEAPAAAQGAIEWPTNPDEDPVIAKARQSAASFTEKLPNYVCTELMTRYQGEGRPVQWHALDVVSSEVVYQDGHESYQKIAVNGKPSKGKSFQEIGGSWSTGEFGTWLEDLLASSTQTHFFHRGEESISQVRTHVFDYRVDKANSHWHVQVAGQWIMPAYKGAIWVDPKTGRVMRIEAQGVGLPDEFPLNGVESAVDYEYVRLGSQQQYLLPVHAENLTCERFSRICSRLVIDFRNYHRFGSESNIQYEEPKK